MGVPAFFRWLTRKYPSIVVQCQEEKAKKNDFTDEKIPVDTSQPNPNGLEFDNLYLDMNGIIHPCTHPEDRPAPKNEEEMMLIIFDFIDRIFSIVRPRKVFITVLLLQKYSGLLILWAIWKRFSNRLESIFI